MNTSSLSRRDVLRTAAVSPLWWPVVEGFLAVDAFAQDRAKPQAGLPPLNRWPRMMQEWLVKQVREVERKSLQRKNALKTKADAEKYVQDVRKRILQSFGLVDSPKKTPLKPRVTKVVKRDAYTIENVIFESRPGFLVTANLYIPRRAGSVSDRSLPGVVGTCGHSSNGKAAGAYQSFAQGLARQGYVVLLYDPLGQGERSQYVDETLKDKIRVGTRQHLHAGNQQFLVGEFLGTWRAWDGIRALDYLLTRKEVDPKRVGVTGNSGGGTMTTWLCGVENRWSMAAPSCFVTTFRRNVENELPADTEQCPPKAYALGLDHDDFIAAMAPKPVILLGKEKDYFDARGLQEAYARLKRLYKLLGHEENIGLFIGPTYHGYSQENREAMYRWFNKATGVSQAKKEPDLKLEKDETLWCTPHGQVAELKSKTVFDFTREKAKQLKTGRGFRDAKPIAQMLGENVVKVRKQERPPSYRIIRHRGRARKYPSRYHINYAVETEPGMHAIVTMLTDARWHSRPPRGKKRAVLYVAHQSSDEELREEPLIKSVRNDESRNGKSVPFFAVDVRGIGESRPGTAGANPYTNPYGADYFYAIQSLMLDRPYVGQRTHDLLRVLDWLRSIGHTEVHLVAKGWGTLPATFAAVLSDQVKQVTLKNALTSFHDVATTEFYDWPLSSFVPNVLSSFDLPDCYAALKAKRLKQIEPHGAKSD